jgi:hypothetical protein
MKIFLTALVLALEWLVQTLPLQNSVGVEQAQDTIVSSSGVQIMSSLIALSPIVMIMLIGLIWKSEIVKLFKKN